MKKTLNGAMKYINIDPDVNKTITLIRLDGDTIRSDDIFKQKLWQ